MFSEVSTGVHAYGIASHRHAPEMEQEMSKAAGRDLTITFTPHLIPMNRGILSTIYVKLADGQTVDSLRSVLGERYAAEPFVQREPGAAAVRFEPRLVKGSSGQAVQNMNLMFGFPEETGLQQEPMFP